MKMREMESKATIFGIWWYEKQKNMQKTESPKYYVQMTVVSVIKIGNAEGRTWLGGKGQFELSTR